MPTTRTLTHAEQVRRRKIKQDRRAANRVARRSRRINRGRR